MIKTLKFKLYNSKRNRKLHSQINCAGMAYNHCIALHKRYFRLFGKSLNKFQLINHLTKIKRLPKFDYMNKFGSQALQDVAERIDKAYKLFFQNHKQRKKCGTPSFCKVSKYKSFTLKQNGYKFGDGNTVIIKKQQYKFAKSRQIEGKIKTLTIKRDNLGDIYIYVICKVEQNEVLARTGKSVGFDFGLKKFLTSSDGQDVESPLFFKQYEKKIAKLNKELSRKKKGSNNRKKAKLNLARAYKRIDNLRADFQWKLANRIVGEYALICIEDLNLNGMKKLYGKKISDLCFGSFVQKLEYCASRTGSTIVKIDRYYPSSQICSGCGYQNKATKDLRIRSWTCPQCGTTHDRDRNAAVNILKVGTSTFEESCSKANASQEAGKQRLHPKIPCL